MKRKTTIKIRCVDHSKMDATIFCPTCQKSFELRDIIQNERRKLEKYKEQMEKHIREKNYGTRQCWFCSQKEVRIKALKKDRNDIRKIPIYDLICDDCGKPINKGRRIGGTCVLISQSMAGRKLLCPEHILEDERKMLLKEFREKILKIAYKKNVKLADLMDEINKMEKER